MSSINSSSPILLWALMYLNPIENMFLCHPTIILCTFFSHSLKKNVCNSKGATYLTRSILSKKFTKPQTSKKKKILIELRQLSKNFHRFWARSSPKIPQATGAFHRRAGRGGDPAQMEPMRHIAPPQGGTFSRTVGTVNESTNDLVDRKFPPKILKRYPNHGGGWKIIFPSKWVICVGLTAVNLSPPLAAKTPKMLVEKSTPSHLGWSL